MWFTPFLKSKAAGKALPKTLQVSTLPSRSETFGQLDRFPQQSRGLLMPTPLEDASLLIGRERQLETLSEALQRWRKGLPTSVALIGPQGSGKTSLINCLDQKAIGKSEVLRCDIPHRLSSQDRVLDFFQRLFQLAAPCESVAQLIEQVMNLAPKIIMMEGGHQVLLRVIGGCRAAEAFFYILLRTRQRHLWMVTCRRLPWENIDRMLGASRYFSHLVDVDCISEEDMRKALALRLEKSGLDVTYCTAEDDLEVCLEKKAHREQSTNDDYYRALLANSGRNFHAALYFMLLGSHYDAASDSLYLRPPDRLDMTFVKTLDHLHLLSLAEIAGHGTLGIREHQQVFRTAYVHSGALLEYLVQVKLAADALRHPNGDGQVFELSPITHHAVTSTLEQLNLIY